MDCAITSLFPAAGAPSPSGEAPAGSGAELAELFASLVAGLSGDEANAASAPQASPESRSLGEPADAADDLEGEDPEAAPSWNTSAWWLPQARESAPVAPAVPDDSWTPRPPDMDDGARADLTSAIPDTPNPASSPVVVQPAETAALGTAPTDPANLATPSGNVAAPSVNAAAPSTDSSAPPTNVTAPSTNVAAPTAGVATASTHVTAPALDAAAAQARPPSPAAEPALPQAVVASLHDEARATVEPVGTPAPGATDRAVEPRSAAPSPPPAPPQAVRALARALAALGEGSAPVRAQETPITALPPAVPDAAMAAAAAPSGAASAAAQALPRSAEPGAPPRQGSSAVPLNVPGPAAAVTAAPDVQTGQQGESGPGFQHRPADPAPGPARALPTSDAIVEALLSGQVPQGRDLRAAPAAVMLPQDHGGVMEHEAAVADQLVHAIKVRAGDGAGEARLRLNPEFLGEVRIELKISGDRVSAVLHVERDDVRQQIESGTPALRAALAAHGLDLDEVTVRDDDASKREGSPQERREPRERRRRDRPGGAFELPE